MRWPTCSEKPIAAQRFVAHHLGGIESVSAALKKVGLPPKMIELGRAEPEGTQIQPLPRMALLQLRRRHDARHEFSDTKHRVLK